MSHNTSIRERLEYLKNFTYDELNRLKVMILKDGENEFGTGSIQERLVSTLSHSNDKDTKSKLQDAQIKHKKAFRRICEKKAHRKYNKK